MTFLLYNRVMPHKGYKQTEEHRRKSRVVGFKKGEKNIAKRPEVRKKIKEAILRRYASGKIAGFQKGHLSCHTLEGDKKISKALQGHIPWNKNKKCPQISESEKGDKHWNWQGGKSFEPYGEEFNNKLKGQIRQRDGYRCQECFRHQNELFSKTGRRYKLMVHHIDYDKENNNSNNLISLCRNCHGQTNFKRENWTNYFRNKTLKV